MITELQLKQIAPKCKDTKELVVALNTLLPKYNITTPLRIAHFISQYAHETMGFTKFVENTNYTSPDRLMGVVVVQRQLVLSKTNKELQTAQVKPYLTQSQPYRLM